MQWAARHAPASRRRPALPARTSFVPPPPRPRPPAARRRSRPCRGKRPPARTSVSPPGRILVSAPPASTRCTIGRRKVLTVQDIVAMPALGLRVAAGAQGLGNEIRWLHASELADPTRWLGGGEFLLSTGIGVGDSATTQRAYVRRLAKHGLAGLGFGLGFGYAEVPPPIVEEADKLGFPVLSVPYKVPFVAISKAVFTHLASEQLELFTQPLQVH